MAEESPKPMGFSKTVGVPPARGGGTSLALGNAGGRPRLAVAPRVPVEDDGQEPAPLRAQTRSHNASDDFHLEALVGEWLLELRMMGRRPRTIEWYRQKMAWYLKTDQAETLGQLTTNELKRYLGELRPGPGR
jgi:hypothetical protein